MHCLFHPYNLPVGPYLQVNSNPVIKEEGKTAALGGGDQKGAAKSSSLSKPIPGKSKEKQTLQQNLVLLVLFLSWE